MYLFTIVRRVVLYCFIIRLYAVPDPNCLAEYIVYGLVALSIIEIPLCKSGSGINGMPDFVVVACN